MADLPADVITNILSRLPVTSLLQFRSTSKSWRSLIDSDHFKTLHLRKSKSNLNLILRSNSEFHTVDFPTLSNAVNLNQPLWSCKSSIITILGSCNGLLCIKNFENVFDNIAIWSPSLRKHWILPSLPTSLRRASRISGFGFGFDLVTEDYKLVKISYFIGVGSTLETELNLFSCRTNMWKTLPSIPYALSWYETTGVFVDHALHWVVVKGNHKLGDPNFIVAFDLRFEVFNEVPLPELGEGFKIDVSQLGGCLSIVVNYESTTRIDIWVMKQYGCKDSWSKRFTLVESLELSFLESRLLEFVKPLGYDSDDDGMKVLFKEDLSKLFWYNLKSKHVSHVTIPGIPKNFDANIWVESLVQPPFPTENYRKKQKQQQALECRYNTSKKRMCLKF